MTVVIANDLCRCQDFAGSGFMPPLSDAFPMHGRYCCFVDDLQRMAEKALGEKGRDEYVQSTSLYGYHAGNPMSPGVRFVLGVSYLRVLPSRTLLSAGAEPTGIEKTLT